MVQKFVGIIAVAVALFLSGAAMIGGHVAKADDCPISDCSHGWGPGCDFGYVWSNTQQVCNPILNPNLQP
jgi:hypothetical protein